MLRIGLLVLQSRPIALYALLWFEIVTPLYPKCLSNPNKVSDFLTHHIRVVRQSGGGDQALVLGGRTPVPPLRSRVIRRRNKGNPPRKTMNGGRAVGDCNPAGPPTRSRFSLPHPPARREHREFHQPPRSQGSCEQRNHQVGGDDIARVGCIPRRVQVYRLSLRPVMSGSRI